MHLKLIHNNQYKSKLYLDTYNRKHWVIGRSLDCDIVIDSSKISRKHCTLIYNNSEDSIFRIIDGILGSFKKSVNGIYFQDTRILCKDLKIGDAIQLPDNYFLEFTNGDINVSNNNTTV